MDVFVIPIGPQGYELYCEQPEIIPLEADGSRAGLIGRIRRWFVNLLKAAEMRRRAPETPPPDEKTGIISRAQNWAMAWVAERIAEQHLLWSLRGETSAVAAYPADMTFEQVEIFIRQALRRDYERHRNWTMIDGLLFVVTFVLLGPLFLLIPGIANLPALYFGFRTVSHFLSMRGASHGLNRVTWIGRSCPPLSELRAAVLLETPARHDRLHDIASRLRLPHLTAFVDRVARVA